jgi:hypothetical protein
MAGLKTLVIGMGIAVLIGATVVVATIIQRGAGLGGEPARSSIALPAGARVVESRIEGGRILLRLRLADGAERLLVNDARTGRPIAVHDLVPGAKGP